jgi:hypothetical protein
MSEAIEEAEYVFLFIYSIEMYIKIIAKGFVLNKYTYLRNPWNWLDFVVIASGYATIGLGTSHFVCVCRQRPIDLSLILFVVNNIMAPKTNLI